MSLSTCASGQERDITGAHLTCSARATQGFVCNRHISPDSRGVLSPHSMQRSQKDSSRAWDRQQRRVANRAGGKESQKFGHWSNLVPRRELRELEDDTWIAVAYRYESNIPRSPTSVGFGLLAALKQPNLVQTGQSLALARFLGYTLIT
jgi:hypothetical protein